jgi:hypothetical protein
MNAGLMAVEGSGMKARFSYAVSRNKQLLEPIIKSLEEMTKPNDEHKKFTDERQELLKEYAKKDEDGNPMVQRIPGPNNQVRESFMIPGINDKDNEFNTKLERLKKKHSKAISEQEEREKKYEEYLDEPVDDFTPIMVDWKLVPDGISQQAMDGVFFMIKEEESVKPARSKKRPDK